MERPIVVVGLPCGGTSVVAQCLQVLGVNMGEVDDRPAWSKAPEGKEGYSNGECRRLWREVTDGVWPWLNEYPSVTGQMAAHPFNAYWERRLSNASEGERLGAKGWVQPCLLSKLAMPCSVVVVVRGLEVTKERFRAWSRSEDPRWQTKLDEMDAMNAKLLKGDHQHTVHPIKYDDLRLDPEGVLERRIVEPLRLNSARLYGPDGPGAVVR